MAKKNFTDSLLGTNRAKKLDMLVPNGSTATETATESKTEVVEKEAPSARTSAPTPTPTPKTATAEAAPKKKRGRKKKDVERDSFFYTVSKEFLFEVKAAAFWDRRDISEFITIALKHYMEKEMGESEIRRAVREFKRRQEEG